MNTVFWILAGVDAIDILAFFAFIVTHAVRVSKEGKSADREDPPPLQMTDAEIDRDIHQSVYQAALEATSQSVSYLRD